MNVVAGLWKRSHQWKKVDTVANELNTLYIVIVINCIVFLRVQVCFLSVSRRHSGRFPLQPPRLLLLLLLLLLLFQ